MNILVFGGTGWIGSYMMRLLEKRGHTTICAYVRLEEMEKIKALLDKVKPDRVVIAAGLTGRPNIDWCEDHKDEVNRVNVVATIFLIQECRKRRIHTTFFGTGCIYEYNDIHTIDGPGFTEEDTPNFDKSYYSLTKIITQNAIENKCLLLRIRMPITDELHPRNFITKITRYEYVIDMPNSMTILDDLLPIAVNMLEEGIEGTFNFTNPGIISHNQILKLYKKYIDPKFSWKNFSLEEQSKILKAGRSNNKLDVTKLLGHYSVPDVHVSMENVFKRMAKKLKVKTLT